MNFKQYLEYREDEDCSIGVIAFDILKSSDIDLNIDDEKIFKILNELFEDTDVFNNWDSLKMDYVAQRQKLN